MRVPALGEAVTHLAWLAPSAASLVALARSATPWPDVRSDPGLLLLLLRHALPPGPTLPDHLPALARSPALLEAVLAHFDRLSPCTDWDQPDLRPIYEACLSYARTAELLAERTGVADSQLAWACGLLAPLGWLAVCAVDPEPAVVCLDQVARGQPAAAAQQGLWGQDAPALARRLARRWALPPWLAATAGHLALTPATAEGVGAHAGLFRLLQLAVLLVQEQGRGLHLPVGVSLNEAAAALAVSPADLPALQRELEERAAASQAGRDWESPAAVPLLPDLLRLAVDNRRLLDAPVVDRLERDVDALHQALEGQRAREAERLQERKLGALAEFAAGAGHEINNPLAVISGQAQYLLGHCEDPEQQQALRTIIGQTRRIHRLLSELMQFARPQRPRPRTVDLYELVRDVLASLSDLAIQRRVQLVYPEEPPLIALEVDPEQVRTALTCLLRNAVEAAPAEGWARVRLEVGAEQVDVVVEDSGAGPAQGLREHLFDPFYSGRSAGRGRGLGLPTAWRLARQQGGDVRFVEAPDGPTRFVLRLPRPAQVNGHRRDVVTNGCHSQGPVG